MKILLLSKYSGLGVTSRIRFFQYLPYLQSQGIQITVSPLLGDDYVQALYSGSRPPVGPIAAAYFRRLAVLLESRRFDLLWVEKEFFPYLPPAFEFLVGLLGLPLVVDYDDPTFHNYGRHPNPLVRLFLSRKIDAVMKRASLVIAGSEYLADHARAAGALRVELIPTVVDLDRYPVTLAPGNDVFTIGWIGQPLNARYLALVRPALEEVCRNGNARIVVVGSRAPQLEGLPVTERPWSEATEAEEISRFNVGIMPLPDEPWERGKCGYKLIQYLACGRPAVASPVGVNRKIIGHGVNGFLASTTEEWVTALRQLRDNLALREQMGASGRVTIEQEYSLELAAPRLADVLRNCRDGV